MGGEQGGNRARGWRRLLWLSGAALASLVILVLYFPSAVLNQRAAAGLTDFLVSKLGPEAICAEVELSWQRVVLRDILLPLGEYGTQLEIARIEAHIDPLIALSQPGEYERMIRRIEVISPRLSLVLGDSARSRSDSTIIPNAVFEVLGRADSLIGFSFVDGQVVVLRGDSVLATARGVHGNLKADGGRFEFSARARSDMPLKVEAKLEGEIRPREKFAEVIAHAELSEGALPFAVGGVDSISTNGATAEFRITQSGQESSLQGWAEVDEVEVGLRSQFFYLPSARLELRGDTLSWNKLEVQGPGISAATSGKVALRDSLRIAAEVTAEVDAHKAAALGGEKSGALNGMLTLDATCAGILANPRGTFVIRSNLLSVPAVSLRNIEVQGTATKSEIEVRSASIASDYGQLSASGRWVVGGEFDAEGALALRPLPELLGLQCGLRMLELSAYGSLTTPEFRWLARDSSGMVLGSGAVAQVDSALQLTMLSLSGGAGRIEVRKTGDEISVQSSNAHIIAPILYPGTGKALASIERLDFDFRGDGSEGEASVTMVNLPAANNAIAKVVKELEFDGAYTRSSGDEVLLSGSWRGMSGDDQEFFGQGDVAITESLLTVTDFYIDEAGTLSGTIEIDTPRVDLSVSIDQLPLNRMPVVATAAESWKLGGVLSGELSASGPLDSIRWYADLSLVDGTAQGVPGYWSLLTADGQNDNITSMFFSFGRGVRSIVEATGTIDIGQNTLDVRVEFPTSDCRDFIQALSGRTGLLSGDLDGEILIFGKLTAPDAVAAIRVTRGEMLGELTVDEFDISAAVTTELDGTRLLTVPQLSFGKAGKYHFAGELSADPRKGGPFRAYLEGDGDFLDMLQQVDAQFTSRGSDGHLRLDLGGTWDAPRYVGGELRLANGMFTYPPARPGELEMQALIHVNETGTVDTGTIHVDAGEDYLQLDMLGQDDPRVADLNPLIIPKPRIDLGVFYLSTSEHGVDVRLPGFMKPEWLGRMTFGTGEFDAITISGFDSTRLRIAGEADVSEGRFTFPFLSYGGGQMRPVTKWLVDRLYEAWWDLDISIGSGTHYDVEITGFRDSDLFTKFGKNPILATVAEYFDHISLDAIVTPTETPLVMEGAIVDSTLRLYGRIAGSTGTADYLDQTFWVDRLAAEFDGTDIFPIISGTGATYGVDSVGRTVPVRLTIYEIDPETNTRVPFGRFEDVTYVLEADGYPDQEQVLGLLGYDLTNMKQGKAEQLLTRTAFTAAKRIWLDPISRKLERATKLDQISLTPGGGASPSVFRQQREAVLRDTLQSEGVVKFLTGSNVTVGKYVTRDVFVTYTGELAEAAGEIEGGRLGLVHYWNLQYRVVPVSPDFVLDFAVEYDEASRRRDESVAVTYSFDLEP